MPSSRIGALPIGRRLGFDLRSIGFHQSIETWSPLEILSCFLLLDGSDLTTLFTDTGATTPVTSVSQAVAAWRSKAPGAHLFTQATAGARPLFGREPVNGPRNILIRSEAFDHAAWVKTGTNADVNNSANPVNSEVTAEKLRPGTSSTEKSVIQSRAKLGVATTYTFSVYLKADGYNTAFLALDGGTSANRVLGEFDLALGDPVSSSAIGTFSGNSISTTKLSGGWVRCVITGTTGTETTVRPVIYVNSTTVYAGNNVSGILAWGAQFERGSSATTYQRVDGAEDITEAGQTSRFGLFSDTGAVRRLVNTMDLSTTSELTICVGFRQQDINTAASGAFIINQNASNNPSFGVVVNSSTRSLGATSSFTTLRSAAGAVVEPNERVVATTIHRCNASPLVSSQKNNIAATTSTLSQGVGNFGNLLVSLMARSPGDTPLYGMLYAVAMFNSTLTGSDLDNTKLWMANKIGITI